MVSQGESPSAYKRRLVRNSAKSRLRELRRDIINAGGKPPAWLTAIFSEGEE